MVYRTLLCLAFVALAAAEPCGAEETVPVSAARTKPVASKPAVNRLAAAKPAVTPAAAKPLDLTIPDISNYVAAAELATPLPEAMEEIIVNGQRPEPLPERQVLPQGALNALLYAGKHPLDAWRILVPDPNFVVPERSEDDVKDPPGAFRGRILEPGAIYD